MEEVIPILLSALLGALCTVKTAGRTRSAAYAAIVILSGAIATVLSGEYQISRIYFLLDGGEAALGLLIGRTIVAWSPALHRAIRTVDRSRDVL